MSSAGRDTAERLGAGRFVETTGIPEGVTTSIHQLKAHDGATTSGVLHHVPGARTVLTLMHPRADVTHNPMLPMLLSKGYAVWTQASRTPNNDVNLIHEEALLDVAAGNGFLRDGYDSVVAVGPSGGAALYAFYVSQASLPAGERLAVTPSGKPCPLREADMPVPDGIVFLAPHPGQGPLLLGCIDPSVADEADPLSVVPELNPFDPANGFAEPPASSSYDESFVTRYREAQRARVARIDERARELVAEATAARKRFKASGDARDRRAAIAPRLVVVYRTDADLRTVDLSLDPSDRPYGSVFGRRPDLTNYGFIGFGRITTADAWLSTWSGLSSNASFAKCGPGVKIPSLLLEPTGDQATFPTVFREIFESLGASDKRHERVAGTHFGGGVGEGPTGTELNAQVVLRWLSSRFESA